MTKISVIIPVYNVEKYLKQCLDSVVNQTLADLEIICIDDGSTDSSGKILDEYAAKDSRIRVIHKENGGYGKAMNIGLDNSIGKYIGIVEPDDYVELNMFESLYNKAVETNVDFIKSDFYQFQEDLQEQAVYLDNSGQYYNRIINPQVDKNVFGLGVNTWTGIYKTEFIKKNNIKYNETPGARYQDQGFWFQTLIFAEKVYFINIPFYHYRFFQTNSTNNPNGFTWIQTEYEYIYDILQKYPQKNEIFSSMYYKFKFTNYLFNYCKLDSLSKKANLEQFKMCFESGYKKGNIDLTVFSEHEQKMFYLLIHNPLKFYRKITNSNSFLENIFSVKKKDHTKIITIAGIKIKIK